LQADAALRVSELTSAAVSRELSLLDERVTPTDASDALAAKFRALGVEAAELSAEEAARRCVDARAARSLARPRSLAARRDAPRRHPCVARAVPIFAAQRALSSSPSSPPGPPPSRSERTSALEARLAAANARVAAAAAQFDAVALETRKIKEQMAASEVSWVAAAARARLAFCARHCLFSV